MTEPANRSNPIAKDELLTLLNELLEAERAGVKVSAAYRDDSSVGAARSLLGVVHAAEARSCALLSKAIQRLGGDPSSRTGDFAERALVVEGGSERLAFLNRGQRWVIRRLEAPIPRVEDSEVANWLGEMLALHIQNVLACEEVEECEA